MKLTKKSVKHEVETEEVVCEITQDEFEKICAEASAQTVVENLPDELDADDLFMGIAMTSLFADFANNICKKLFDNKTENPDKKEEK